MEGDQDIEEAGVVMETTPEVDAEEEEDEDEVTLGQDVQSLGSGTQDNDLEVNEDADVDDVDDVVNGQDLPEDAEEVEELEEDEIMDEEEYLDAIMAKKSGMKQWNALKQTLIDRKGEILDPV